LPKGIKVEPFYDQSLIVNQSISSVRDAILLGLILASIILVVFLRDWGTSIVAGLVIPVTVSVTFIALKMLGESFNLMTLGGLAAAVGLVIDDAIVVVENIVLHRDAGQGRLQAIPECIGRDHQAADRFHDHPCGSVLALISIAGVTGTFLPCSSSNDVGITIHLLDPCPHVDAHPQQFFIRRKRGAEEVPEETERGHDEDINRLLAAEEASAGQVLSQSSDLP